MSEIIQTRATILKFLRSLFNDNTTDLLILKELIQNADDSKGTFIALGCSEGLAEAAHPLLRAPAIFAINNGPLSQADARAIISMGVGTKGADASTVGKFGLGLKSAFYLTEALFFMDARLDPSEVWTPPHFDVLSPWLGKDSPRPEWGLFSPEDRQRILEHLRALGLPEGFVVWIPLRREQDCPRAKNGLTAAVMPHYPGDQALGFSEATLQDIGEMLPMFGYLERVILKASPAPGTPLITFERQGASRTAKLDLPDPFERLLEGTIHSSPLGPPARYAGKEALVDHPALHTLRNSTSWPSSAVDEDSGEPVGDPSVPHGAAVWQRTPVTGQPTLRVGWSVFLPVEQLEKEDLPLIAGAAHQWSYTLTLHGYFFLKPDRKSIYHWKAREPDVLANEEQVREAWNRQLASATALPFVLEGLAKITAEVPDEEITALTSKLRNSDTGRDYLTALTAHHQWVRQWRGGQFRWTLASPATTFLPVPNLPDLTTLLPELEQFARLHPLRDGTSTCFLVPPKVSQWPLNLAQALLQPVDLTLVVGRPPLMALLRALMFYLPAGALAADLLLRLRTAFAEVNPALVSRHKSEVAALLSTLLPGRVIMLPESMSPALVARLTQARVSVLLVPHGYVLSSAEKALTLRDAETLLDCIETEEEIGPVLRFLGLHLQPGLDLDALTQHRPLLPTARGTAGGGAWITPHQARVHLTEARIFSQNRDTSVMLGHLQDVLGDDRLYLVPGAIATLLGLSDIPQMGSAAVLQTVQQASTLGPAKARLALLHRLLETAPAILDRTEHRATLRLLLHGQPNQVSHTGVPLLIGTDRSNLWWKVAKVAAPHSPLRWTVVEERVDFLTPRQMKQLGVVECGPASLTDLLAAAPHAFPAQQLNAAERTQLILELEHVPLLKQLPIFTATDQTLVSLSPTVHVEGGFPVDAALASKVTLLQAPRDPADAALLTRLRSLAPPLTARGAWDYLQYEPEPWQHWKTLLDVLSKLSSRPPRADELPWWPLKAGGGVAPKDVLAFHHRDSAGEIRQLRDASGKTIPVAQDLLPEFLETFDRPSSPAPLLASADTMRDRLLALISAAPTYFVGSSGQQASAALWLDAFDSAPVSQLPLIALLQVCTGMPDIQRRLLQQASRPVSPERLVWMLTFLHRQATTATTEPTRTAARQLYPTLLADVRDQRLPISALEPLHFLNMAGQWKKADDLTRQGTQLDPQAVLCTEHAVALYGTSTPDDRPMLEALPVIGNSPVDTLLVNSTQDLIRHLRTWESTSVPREQLGAFLGLLDGNPKLHSAAQGYLATFNVGVLRENAYRDVPADKLPHGFRSYQTILDRTRLLVTVTTGEHTTVPNLLGEALKVAFQADSQLTSLFTQRHDARPFRHGDWFVHPVDLKLIDLKQAGLDLSDLLFRSLQWVLEHYHPFLPPHLHATFNEVVDSSQITVTATQQCLIKAASQLWGSQLGLERSSQVRHLLSAIKTATRNAEQARVQRTAASEEREEQRIRELQEQLKGLLEGDRETQQALLSGVRKKVTDMQYVADSVPFELLQNADDALTEWQTMTGEVDPRRQTFSLDLSPELLRVAHHGRPVNFFSSGDFDGKARGFDGDLEKMLTLMSSDKEAGVTGKFGLGFKSVFLLSDEPSVQSGRLAFTVKGGVYPVVPQEDHVQRMRAYLKGVSAPEVNDGTLIELPLREHGDAAAAVTRFAALAPLALAFLQAVRQIDIGQGQTKQRFTWHEVAVNAHVAAVRVQSGNRVSFRALAIQTPEIKLLLPVNDEGFTALPPGTPNLWVTAPTGEVLGLPFLVNAAFPLDPGRAQLARNEALLHALVQELKPQLQGAITDLLASLETPSRLTGALGWGTVGRAAVLDGLWNTLALPLARTSDHQAHQVLRDLLWGTGGAYGALTLTQALIPTGLPGPYQQHVQAGDPGVATADFSAATAAHLGQQASFRRAFPPGTLVARETTAAMRALGLPAPQRLVTLKDVLTRLLPDQRVTRAIGEWLPTVLSDEVLSALREDEAVDTWLDGLSFLAQDGQYRPASELLVGAAKEGSEEAQRFAFAPQSVRLSAEYSPAALALFRRLRPELPPVKAAVQSVEWILAAKGEARAAALQYLSLKGPGEQVIVLLRPRLQGTWLAYDQLVLLPQWETLDQAQQMDVLNVLRQLRKEAPSLPVVVTEPADEDDLEELLSTSLQPEEVLRRMQTWWAREGITHVHRFNTRTYPEGTPLVSTADFEADDPASRQAWMSLLMLGSLQTMGRTQPESHRNFLKLCQDKGWLATFSHLETSDEQWMAILRDYLAGDAEVLKYAHWMRGFVGFYQLGQWLEPYVELMFQLDRMTGSLTLRTLLSPNANPLLQGSGLSAPPLTRTLGIGGPFVIRELLRARVLTNPDLHPLAYMPTRRVRLLMARLMNGSLPDDQPEQSSRSIHSFLAKRLGAREATFGGHFDLPLQALLGTGRDDFEAAALQHRVLGQSLFEGVA